MINKRIVDRFIRLTSIDAPTFHEAKIAAALQEMLLELGIQSENDWTGAAFGSDSGNVWAVWEGDPALPPIMLSAHMDTVSPAVGKQPVINGDRIESAGDTVLGADDAAGIVEILEGIQRVQESGKPHRTVELLFCAAEEVYTQGACAFDYSRFHSKEAYCLDLSGDIGIAAIKAPSLISFHVEITGRASHAGFAPQEGINAILTASKAITRIPQGQIDPETTANIGTISGGIATNIISEKCTVTGEVRSFNHQKALNDIEEIRAAFETAANETGAAIDFTSTVHLIAYENAKNAPVVQRFREAAARLGIKSTLISTLGGADNHQFMVHGINGLVLSCGMEKVHTTGEYIKIENLEIGAELVEQLILAD